MKTSIFKYNIVCYFALCLFLIFSCSDDVEKKVSKENDHSTMKLELRLGDSEIEMIHKLRVSGAVDVSQDTDRIYTLPVSANSQAFYWWQLKDKSILVTWLHGDCEITRILGLVEKSSVATDIEDIGNWSQLRENGQLLKMNNNGEYDLAVPKRGYN